MPLNWNFNGPYAAPGQIYSAVGTSVVITAGLPVAYTGLVLQNPAVVAGTTAKKITVLKVGFALTGTGGTQGAPIGIAKFTGGTAVPGLSASFSGPIFPAGASGTSTTQTAVLAGTCTLV